jgi:hypothetical protein
MQRIAKSFSLGFFEKNSLTTRLKATFQCSVSERNNFSNSQAQLTISVGQPHHEERYLAATVELVNKNFKSALIMLDDSLQAPTLEIKNEIETPIPTHFSKEYWLKQAIALGDDWLQRNKEIYSRFTIPVTIVRWSSWLNSSEFNEAIQFANEQYECNAEYRTAILNNARTFLMRQKNYENLSEDVKKKLLQLGIDYLKQETGVMNKIWTQYQCEWEIYPSKRNEAMAATYKLWIEPNSPNLLKPIALRFNKKNIEIKSYENQISPLISLSHKEIEFDVNQELITKERNRKLVSY